MWASSLTTQYRLFVSVYPALCVVAALCLAAPLHAQEASSKNTDTVTATNTASEKKQTVDKEKTAVANTTETEKPEQTANRSSDETFVPTEDISEDLSVSFPVDI